MSQALATRDDDDDRFESAIVRAASDQSIDIGKLQALLDMQRMVARERAVRMFNTAMAAAQGEMEPVLRDTVNTHTKSRYAKLETIDRAMRPVYTRHGFSVRFGSQPSPRQGWMRITCTVAHTGGHYEENYLDAPPDDAGTQGRTNKTPIQSVGSSVTYLRRYLLTMVFNIVLSDDIDQDADGNTPPREQPTERRERAYAPPVDPLDEENGPRWLANLTRLAASVATLNAAHAVARHARVLAVLKSTETPPEIRTQINDVLRKMHERLAEPPQDDGNQSDDPIAELIAEIDAMDLIGLDALPSSAPWRVKTRDLFPPDADRVAEAIALRSAVLRGSK